MASAKKPPKSTAPATDYRNAVKYSRAGDVFHYRWAARRCLRMIDPQSGIESITVEGSKEPLAPGEYVIDLSEYSVPEKNVQRVRHFQLKHSTVRLHEEVNLGELKKTIKGFAARFLAAKKAHKSGKPRTSPTFAFVTNRKVAEEVTQGVTRLAAGTSDALFEKKLAKYIKLSNAQRMEFCQSLSFLDRQDDYLVQKRKLQGEIAQVLAGFVDGDDAELVVSLVADRVMPKSENGRSDGQIVLEDVLQKLGVTSQRDLFPAPPQFDPLVNPIRREQQNVIAAHILGKAAPSIIHAAGGIGKSVVVRLVADSLPTGFRAVIYDCFGSGRYLSPSEPRHRARDALVQIANELAAQGLCQKLLPRRGLVADDFFRAFLERVAEAVRRLREINPKALLVLLIDAADNAEMAAKDNNDPCFASALLKCALPPGCRLAMFARTERVPMLRPGSKVRLFPLANFSEQESFAHLRRSFPNASAQDGREFFRLSGGNPRVQANALAAGGIIETVLAGLGPQTTTLNAQIGQQLRVAVDKVKATHSGSTSEQVDAICYGLANLPPLIPIPILAKAAGVTPDAVKSFVADLGRPLWHSDDAVQFRDEPTETWFREQFAADAAQVKAYVATLEPLAQQSAYVAKAVPQLLLRAGEYEKLVSIALSDTHLPSNNPIEQRNVRVYRLQFAFKAAIKLGRLMDAGRLAFRAGEEVAGDQRQTELLARNVDLVATLEEPNRVQEIAYRHLLGGGWPGCENIYSAALLSSFADFKGDARAFLRSAHHWLGLYFQDRDERRKKINNEERFHHQEPLRDDHLLELWWARYNLMGAAALVEYMVTWKPQDLPFRLMRVIVRRLIDANRFPAVDELARAGTKVPYLMLAISDELNAVGRLPPKGALQPSLMFFDHSSNRPGRPQSYRMDDSFSPALVSFLEACAAHGLTARTIRRTLDHYDDPGGLGGLGSDYQEGGRCLFLRRAMLRAVLAKQPEPKIENLLPEKDSKVPRDHEDDNRDQMLSRLLPWHYARTRLILGRPGANKIDLKGLRDRTGSGHGRYRQFDRLPHELAAIRFEVLAWKKTATAGDLDSFVQETLPANQVKFWLPDRLDATRAAFRLNHLAALRDPLEQSCQRDLEVIDTDGPNERADYYVRLGRAVLAQNHDDAVAYFGLAVDAVAKFGDEMVARWEAVVAVANRSVEPGQVSAELIYRFVRCAEVIGDTVGEEKYWSRNDVFRVTVRLDPSAAFAAISRWRDRNVGWFQEQLEALTIAAVEEHIAPPVSLWGLSGFGSCNESLGFAEACLRAETDQTRRQQLLERIVRDSELASYGPERWRKLRDLSRELNVPSPRLAELLNSGPLAKPAVAATKEANPVSDLKKSEEKRWSMHFQHTDVTQAGAMAKAIKTFNATVPRDPDIFWTEVLKSVPRGSERKMLRQIAGCEALDYYDSGCVVKFARAHWLGRAAVRTEWPLFLEALGRRFTAQFSDRGSLRYWQRSDQANASDILEIRRGVLAGLADSLDLVDASTFFGFVTNTANDLTPAEARTLLAYALERFERHIDLPTYADGPFQPWLAPASDVPAAQAGLVWTALGSPFAETRWEAAHCIRRWAELGCDIEIDALIDWARQGTAGAFASRKLPFYALHAKLYAQLAFARVAVDHPRSLARHAAWFSDVAQTGMAHWLIQKTAAETSIAIEGAIPGTYPTVTLANLRNVGRSTLSPRVVTGPPPTVDSPRHAAGQVDTSLTFHFGLDFGDSWLRPLGDAFGVPQSQVEELTREVLVNEMGVPRTGDHRTDPRQNQWNSRDRDTWLHGSGYPRTDDHRFYLWYHGMMSVAARLLSALPVIVHADRIRNENEWDNWANGHGLTRDDGRWLSDRRDPDPRVRRPWLNSSHSADWLWAISPDDFSTILHQECPLADGLCVEGRWSDCSNGRSETIWVESTLVDPRTSRSLANSLRLADGPNFYRFPPYNRSDRETAGTAPFDMIGWIIRPDGDDRRIDSFDPYAKAITDPPLDIGPSFAAQLGLSADRERRSWRKQPAGEIVALGEIWSDRDENNSSRRESPYRWGRRLSAKVSLLRELCTATKRDLVISVAVDRNRKDGYEKELPDIPASHKIFVLSVDGRLHDATKSYHLG